MTDYVFPGMVALDKATGAVVRNGTGQIYDVTDTSSVTPIVVKDAGSGTTMTWVEIGAAGITPDLLVPDRLTARWSDGTNSFIISSPDGPVQQATQAATAAQTAQVSAAQAATAALAAQAAAEEAAAGGGGGTVDGGGNGSELYWDGTGTEPGRVWPVGHPQEGSAIPLWAVISWAWPAYPTYSLPGDFWDRV